MYDQQEELPDLQTLEAAGLEAREAGEIVIRGPSLTSRIPVAPAESVGLLIAVLATP